MPWYVTYVDGEPKRFWAESESSAFGIASDYALQGSRPGRPPLRTNVREDESRSWTEK